MKGKYAKHFTEEQIQKFKADPNVRYVDDHTIRFIYEFRIKLYEAWEQEKRQGVKRVLTENGYSLKELGRRVIDTLCGMFKERGRPTYAKSNLPVGVRSYHRIDSANNEYLLSTGMFVKSKYGKGITFSDEFRNQLFKAYPEQMAFGMPVLIQRKSDTSVYTHYNECLKVEVHFLEEYHIQIRS